MTHMLTVRVPSELMTKADKRASQLGLDRSRYVRWLIEQDLAVGSKEGRRRRFASEEFIGSVPLGRGAYANRRVRAIIEQRLRFGRQENR